MKCDNGNMSDCKDNTEIQVNAVFSIFTRVVFDSHMLYRDIVILRYCYFLRVYLFLHLRCSIYDCHYMWL